jgi:hypothetical protein
MNTKQLFFIAEKIEQLTEDERKKLNGILKTLASDMRVTVTEKKQLKDGFKSLKDAWNKL